MATTETKKKKSNGAVWFVIILIVIILIIVAIRSKKPASLPTQPAITTGGSTAGTTTTTYISVTDSTVLKKGMNNAHVGKLQTLINKVNTSYGLPLITVDNSFGSGTEAALLKLTGKTEISYAAAEAAAKSKFKEQGYTDGFISGILDTFSTGFGLFG